MKTKAIAMFLVLTMGFILLAGCGNSSSTTTDNKATPASTDATAKTGTTEAVKPVTIKYLNNGANGGHEEHLKAMIADFQKKNPGITVESEIIAYKDYYTKLNTILNAGSSGVDVFEVGYENFYTYAAKNMLKPMDDIIAKDTTYNPNAVKKAVLDAYKYNGKQYGMCTDYSCVLMVYNKDLFDEKKVAYPKADWTWKEELAAAQQLTDASKGIWGTIAPFQAYEFYKTIAQNGGSIWGADGKSVTINSKEVVEAVQWMLDKSTKYKVQPLFTSDIFTQADADVNAFAAGKVAMFRTGVWNLDKFTKGAKFKWDVALEPGNTKKAHHFFSNATVASKDTKNGDAAWKFMKYMASDSTVVDSRIKNNWSLPVTTDKAPLEAYLKLTPPDSKQAILDTANSLVMPPLGPIPEKWSELTKIIEDELNKMKFDKQTVQQGMDIAKTKIEALAK